MADLQDSQIYSVLGDDGITRLVAAFYRRVRSDDVLGPLYPPEDFEAAERRLRAFLIQRFGGPDTYSQERGHPRLRMRHSPFKINLAGRNRWIQLMQNAIDETAPPKAVIPLMLKYFDDAATFMINHPG